MDRLVKGSRAPREVVSCERCGAKFERAVVHPYVVTCPACRGRPPAAAAPPASRDDIAGVALRLRAAADLTDDEWLDALSSFKAACRGAATH